MNARGAVLVLFTLSPVHPFTSSLPHSLTAFPVHTTIPRSTLSRLPRAGAWMLTVKKGFALIMLGMAEYYLVKMGQVYF